METTRQKTAYLKWAVWVCAGLLAAAVGLLIFLEAAAARKQATVEPPELYEVPPAETEATLPEITEPTLPILNLPANPYGPEDFSLENGYLTCTGGDSLLGVDVSAWQEQIDWQQVKEAGVDFAMIRLAWRGTSEGGIYPDERAVENYEGAKAAGLQVGGYFFSQAITPEEAVAEAEFLLAMTEGWEFDLPIVFDWEFVEDARTDGTDAETLTACAKAFCRTVEAAGRRPMVYFNPIMAYYQIDLEALEDYGFWLAMWQAEMDFPYKVDMWQYTDQGTVPGIEGNVDLNIYFAYDHG